MKQSKKSFHFHLIPVLIVLACTLFIAKFTDLVLALKSPNLQTETKNPIVSIAQAGEGVNILKSDTNKETDTKDSELAPLQWRDASDTELEYSNSRIKILGDLSKRRQELEKIAEGLEQKRSLLDATKQQIYSIYIIQCTRVNHILFCINNILSRLVCDNYVTKTVLSDTSMNCHSSVCLAQWKSVLILVY